MKIGDRVIEETDKYTYLGEVNNKCMNLKDHIKNVEGKVEGAYQTLIAVTEDREFKGIQMESVWKLIQACIIPIITYACETWEPNKQEMKKLNQILDKIIRRVLMTPDSTPREALYIETGMMDIEAIIDTKRLNMMARLKRERTKLMDTVLKHPQCKWMKRTREIMSKYNIFEWELAGTDEDKHYIKQMIYERVRTEFKRRLSNIPDGKSKIIYFLEGKGEWKPEITAHYMNKMTRKQASTIFKTRTRMIKVKGNYKNGHTDLTCRMCNHGPETQSHALLECKILHPHGKPECKEMEPFSNDINILKETARNVERIMEQISNGSMVASPRSSVTPANNL